MTDTQLLVFWLAYGAPVITLFFIELMIWLMYYSDWRHSPTASNLHWTRRAFKRLLLSPLWPITLTLYLVRAIKDTVTA